MRPYLWGTVSMPNCSEMLQLNDAQTPPVINIQETSLLCLQVLMLHSPRPPVDKFYSHLEALLLLIPGHGAISIIIYKLQPPGEEQSSEFFRCQSSCTVTETLVCSSLNDDMHGQSAQLLFTTKWYANKCHKSTLTVTADYVCRFFRLQQLKDRGHKQPPCSYITLFSRCIQA